MRTIEKLNRILVPVTMLEEEVYKAEICTYLARKTGAQIVLLLANDYGSRAKKNMQRIIAHIESVAQRTNQSIQYEQHLAIKDSFSVYKEATQRQRDFGHQLLVMTASRDYGLDDLIFGAPEQHVIQHSAVPVMLINPREDLFSLCD
jgi:nucleotide-binding universal stress UspA family protein